MARQVQHGIPGNAAVGSNPRTGNPQSLPISRAQVKSSRPLVVPQLESARQAGQFNREVEASPRALWAMGIAKRTASSAQKITTDPTATKTSRTADQGSDGTSPRSNSTKPVASIHHRRLTTQGTPRFSHGSRGYLVQLHMSPRLPDPRLPAAAAGELTASFGRSRRGGRLLAPHAHPRGTGPHTRGLSGPHPEQPRRQDRPMTTPAGSQAHRRWRKTVSPPPAGPATSRLEFSLPRPSRYTPKARHTQAAPQRVLADRRNAPGVGLSSPLCWCVPIAVPIV